MCLQVPLWRDEIYYIDTTSCTINKRIPLCLEGEVSQAAANLVFYPFNCFARRNSAHHPISLNLEQRRIHETIEFSICNYWRLSSLSMLLIQCRIIEFRSSPTYFYLDLSICGCDMPTIWLRLKQIFHPFCVAMEIVWERMQLLYHHLLNNPRFCLVLVIRSIGETLILNCIVGCWVTA